jgi:hypothetical protein
MLKEREVKRAEAGLNPLIEVGYSESGSEEWAFGGEEG